MRKTAFFFLFFFTFAFSLSLTANASVFEIRLRYDAASDRLDADESQGQVIRVNDGKDISITEYVSAPEVGKYEYTFLDNTGNIVDRRRFPTKTGPFVLEIPYYSTAVSFSIRKEGVVESIFSMDIAALSSCDNDGICESETGENNVTCIPDCAAGGTVYSVFTEQRLKDSGGFIRDDRTGDVILGDISMASAAKGSNETSPAIETGSESAGIPGRFAAIGGIPGLLAVIAVFIGIFSGTIMFVRRQK